MKNEKFNPLKQIKALVEQFLPRLAAGCTTEEAITFINQLTAAIPIVKQDLRTAQLAMKLRDFRLLIHTTQQELMWLTGSLITYVDAQELCVPTTPLSILCHNACHELNELISTLSKQYAECLPKAVYAPENYRTITAYQLFHGLAELVEELKAYETPPLLIETAMAPFSECTRAGRDMTLAQLSYLRLLKRQLTYLVQQAAERKTPIEEIVQVMFRALNFNSLAALQYMVGQINDALKTLDNTDAQHQFLAYCRMGLLFMPPMEPNLALHPDLPALHDQLLTWINDEDDRILRMDRSESQTGNPGPQLPLGIPNAHKALLIKVQLKAKGYNCTQYHAIKVSQQIFCAANGDQIGVYAWEKYFKDVEASTVRGVIAHLEHCLDILKTDYRELLKP